MPTGLEPLILSKNIQQRGVQSTAEDLVQAGLPTILADLLNRHEAEITDWHKLLVVACGAGYSPINCAIARMLFMSLPPGQLTPDLIAACKAACAQEPSPYTMLDLIVEYQDKLPIAA